jgi:hypothetical protein
MDFTVDAQIPNIDANSPDRFQITTSFPQMTFWSGSRLLSFRVA